MILPDWPDNQPEDYVQGCIDVLWSFGSSQEHAIEVVTLIPLDGIRKKIEPKKKQSRGIT